MVREGRLVDPLWRCVSSCVKPLGIVFFFSGPTQTGFFSVPKRFFDRDPQG